MLQFSRSARTTADIAKGVDAPGVRKALKKIGRKALRREDDLVIEEHLAEVGPELGETIARMNELREEGAELLEMYRTAMQELEIERHRDLMDIHEYYEIRGEVNDYLHHAHFLFCEANKLADELGLACAQSDEFDADDQEVEAWRSTTGLVFNEETMKHHWTTEHMRKHGTLDRWQLAEG